MKQVLIIGFGKTGQAFYRHEKATATISIYDDREIRLSEPYLPYDETAHYDYALISPGVSPSHPVWKACVTKGIPVYGEIEYAYQSLRGYVVGITGTNGKTTTTTLTFEMIRRWHERTFLAGNIGFPLLDYVMDSKPGDIYVTELSSFQLDTTHSFTPRVAAITNLTPDHLQWHLTMEDYISAKFKLFHNLTDYNQVVINRDDQAIEEALLKRKLNPKDFFGFSHNLILENGCFIEDGKIIFQDTIREEIIDRNDILLNGIHNLENCLCAISLAKKVGVPTECIQAVLKEFSGIAHRYEVIGEKGGRRFINDSKATNPDSTIPALKSIERPTIWIGGGMNKGSDFVQMFELTPQQVDRLILFGENKLLMKQTAEQVGFDRITIVENLDQAFDLAIQLSQPGYDILLSPASASWDMYPNFEARGDHFKRLVGALHV